MSELHVEVVKIDDVRDHPNADRLQLATVKGWQVVVQKGIWETGDMGVYFPPDTILPEEWTENFGVTQYTSKGRIRSTRLRGEVSHGLVVKPGYIHTRPEFEVGADVAEYFSATKYEPPKRHVQGESRDRQPDHPKFSRYTEIENLRHFPAIFEGLDVVVTEKIHGANVRIGVIEGKLVAGSRRVQRGKPTGKAGDTYLASTYWWPLQGYPGIRRFLESFIEPQSWWQRLLRRPKKSKTVIVYGEVFGPSIQSFDYGLHNGSLDFRAFDIMVDGKFLDYYAFENACVVNQIPYAPVLYEGPYDLDTIKLVSEGYAVVGGTHIREGVVVRPVTEKRHPTLGRMIAKYVSDAYLLKDKSDYTEE